MKQDDEIDKLFKDNWKNIDVPDIPQSYLDDINKRLDNLPPPKKKKRRYFLFWLIPVLGTASFVLYYALSSDSLSNKADSNEKASSQYSVNADKKDILSKQFSNKNGIGTVNSTTIQPTVSGSTGLTKNDESMDGNEVGTTTTSDRTWNNVHEDNAKGTATINTAATPNLKESTKNKSNSVTATSANVLADAEGIVKSTSKNKTNKNLATISSLKPFNGITKASKTIANDTKQQSDSDSKKSGTTILPSAADKSEATVKSSANDSIIQSDKKDSLANEQKELAVDKKNVDSLQTTAIDSIAKTEKDSLKQNIADNAKAPADSSKKNTSKDGFAIQFLAGAFDVNSAFSSQNSTYDAIRKQQENAIWTFGATLLISYKKNNFVYSAGIDFSQWGEKIKYATTTSSVQYLVKNDTTYSSQQTGPNDYTVISSLKHIYGNKSVENNTLTAHNGVNRYSYVSIPLLVGYNFLRDVFTITPKIGGTIGVPVQSTGGYYISPNLQELVQEKATPWLVNFQASVDFRYSYFTISPFYRRNLSALIHSENTTNLYSGWGIQLGIYLGLH